MNLHRKLANTSRRGLLLAFGPVLVVLLMGVVTYAGLRLLDSRRLLVRETATVIASAQATLSDLQDAETGQRGFLLTGEERYLEPYGEALATLTRDTAALRQLMPDLPAQQRRLDSLAAPIAAKLAEMDQTIALRRTQGLAAAVAVVRTDRGRTAMDEIRRLIGAIEREQQARLTAHVQAEQRFARMMTGATVAGTLVGVSLAILLTLLVARYAESQASAARAADAANRAKSEFLTMMSHELRTPLNAIAGYADLLVLDVHGPLNDAQRDAVSRIQRSERHLLSLINELLNFSKLEAGRVEFDTEPVPLREVVADVLAMTTPQLQAKQLATEVHVPPDLVACADREKVQQILLNLVSNAVKFTDAGGAVRIEAPPRAGANGEVLIRVADTGIGIPADKHEAIFDPFVQVHRTRSSTREGTGLGLAISRNLARGMGGDLCVQSLEGEGSTFTLTLPAV